MSPYRAARPPAPPPHDDSIATRLIAGLVTRLVGGLGVATIVATVWALPTAAHAQVQRTTRLHAAVGATVLDFARLGGTFGSVLGELGVTHHLGPGRGIELDAFAVVPGGSAATDPACPPNADCTSSQTPSLVTGALLSPFVQLQRSGIRLAPGVGFAHARGGYGFGDRSSFALGGSATWASARRTGVVPTVGLRYLRLASGVAGVRHLLLPAVGVAF